MNYVQLSTHSHQMLLRGQITCVTTTAALEVIEASLSHASKTVLEKEAPDSGCATGEHRLRLRTGCRLARGYVCKFKS